jgi:hypothetical protein
MVECLPCKCETLNSNPSVPLERERERESEREKKCINPKAKTNRKIVKGSGPLTGDGIQCLLDMTEDAQS